MTSNFWHIPINPILKIQKFPLSTYVDPEAKIFLILYPPFENSITRTAIVEDQRLIHVQNVHRALLHSQGCHEVTGVNQKIANGWALRSKGAHLDTLMDNVKKIYLFKEVNDSLTHLKNTIEHFSRQIVWWICRLIIRQLINQRIIRMICWIKVHGRHFSAQINNTNVSNLQNPKVVKKFLFLST